MAYFKCYIKLNDCTPFVAVSCLLSVILSFNMHRCNREIQEKVWTSSCVRHCLFCDSMYDRESNGIAGDTLRAISDEVSQTASAH